LCPLCCPQCSSSRLYKDGLRRLGNGDEVQRKLCRDCGYRFSEKPLQENSKWSINSPVDLGFNSQLCAFKKDAKKLTTAIETKTIAGETPQDIKGKTVEFSFWLLKQGYSQATITGRVKLLNRLMRLGANLSDGESIKEIIAKQTWSISRKVNAVDAYDSLLKMQRKTWTPQIYRRVRKLPFIPTEAEIDQLIAGCSKKMATFLQLLKETGMRCGEACNLLKWTDIDLEQRSVRITPEKGSTPRILPLSIKIVDMLTEMPKNTQTVFSVNADRMRHNFE